MERERFPSDRTERPWGRLMFSAASPQQPSQFFLLTGLLLENRLTLLADATDREGDSSFTLSSKVFLMAAGEIFSWSAKCCSSLQWGGGEKDAAKERDGERGGASFAGSLGLPRHPPRPDAGSLHSIDQQRAKATALQEVQGMDGGSAGRADVVLQLTGMLLRL